MTIKDFYTGLSAKEKADLAKRLGTVVPYLSQIAHGHARPGAKLAVRIARASKGRVTKSSLRPDLWG